MIKEYENAKSDLICDNIAVSDNGTLLFAGQSVKDLAKNYGTPLYLFDEDRIIDRCLMFNKAANEAFNGNYEVLFASKAASFGKLYDIMKQNNVSIDVVSAGELICAYRSGFPANKAYFHSNNKTDEDISTAIDLGIGTFVSDNLEELDAINKEAEKRGIIQNVILRITPGIDPHTFAAVSTGKVDSKFGFAIQTLQAEKAVEYALSLTNVNLTGFHCHVGSQVFEPDVFILAVEAMVKFIADMRDKFNYTASVLDLGGGFGVKYIEAQPDVDIPFIIKNIGEKISSEVSKYKIKMPKIMIEPGRSMVADAGMTLYTVGSVKRIPEFINYVSVDGGMTDNVRFAMYGSEYTFLPANKMLEKRNEVFTVAGRCCESGDLLGKNIKLPHSIKRGDILAVCTTGAYNYSMSSNYNRIPRPAVVMLKNGESYIAVKRETAEDLISNDLFTHNEILK